MKDWGTRWSKNKNGWPGRPPIYASLDPSSGRDIELKLDFSGRRGGLMVSALDSRSSGPGSLCWVLGQDIT